MGLLNCIKLIIGSMLTITWFRTKCVFGNVFVPTKRMPATYNYSTKKNVFTTTTTRSVTAIVTPYVGSRITVHIPQSLYKEDGLDHTRAEFGFPSTQSRGSIHAFVYFVDDTLCDPLVTSPKSLTITSTNDKNDSKNITITPNRPRVYPITTTTNTSSIDAVTFQTPFILMVRDNKGMCSSVVQVRNGQGLGAAAVVIGAEYCRCADTECTKQYGPACYADDAAISYLMNDGSGGDITIPSFLLHRIGANAITTVMQNNLQQPLLMELSWGLPALSYNDIQQEPVYYYLWMTTHDSITDDINMLLEMKLMNQKFTTIQAIFTPHYNILDGSKFGCTNTADDGICKDLCTNHGRYCTIHPHTATNNLTGRNILIETVRQVCIYNLYANPDTNVIDNDNGRPDMYWDYIIYHKRYCNTPSTFNNEQCIMDAYKNSSIPYNTTTKRSIDIEKCMASNGNSNFDSDTTNPILEHEMHRTKQFGIHQLPAMVVNNYPLPAVSTSNLFIEICNYYTTTYIPTKYYPNICDTCVTCPNIIGCLEQNKCVDYIMHTPTHQRDYDFHDMDQTGTKDTNNKSRRRRRHGWFYWMFLSVVVIGGSYYLFEQYYPTIRHRIHSLDRSSLLHDYFPLGTSPLSN